MELDLDAIAPPADGIWRVGRDPDVLSSSRSEEASRLGKPNTGNRFDSPTAEYGVRYFSTTLEGCYGETLARFRADLRMKDVIGDEWATRGFMHVGDIPADWRQRRTAVRVDFPGRTSSTGVRFLDIESMKTREAITPDFEPLLRYHNYTDLDVAVIRSQDRRITRYISQWTWEQVDDGDQPLYAGIRYLSRLNSDWECWAVFDRVPLVEITRRPILLQDEDIQKIASMYGLTLF